MKRIRADRVRLDVVGKTVSVVTQSGAVITDEVTQIVSWRMPARFMSDARLAEVSAPLVKTGPGRVVIGFQFRRVAPSSDLMRSARGLAEPTEGLVMFEVAADSIVEVH